MRKGLLLVLLLAVPTSGVAVSVLLASGVDASSMRLYDHLLRYVTVPAGLIALSWLGLVHAAGIAARRSRRLLLRFFLPGLHVTRLVALALVLATAIVAIAPVPLLMTTFGGEWSVKVPVVLLVLAASALGGIVGIGRAFPVVRRTTASVVGKVAGTQDAPALWSVVREVCGAVGAEPPDHLVLGLAPSFYVTEAPVRCVDGRLTGRTMVVSLPLCRILRVDELRAILGHELAHFAGLDTRFIRRFFPVYRGTEAALRGLASTEPGGAASIALLPAVSLLAFYLDAFAAAERNVSRERELVADRGGARVTSAGTMATALVKVDAFSDLWVAAEHAMAEALREHRMSENASVLFAELVVANASATHLVGLDERRVADPTDSHPPLALRVATLGASWADVAEGALDVDPRDPAIGLVDAPDRFERELSEVEQVLLARRLGLSRSGRTEMRAG